MKELTVLKEQNITISIQKVNLKKDDKKYWSKKEIDEKLETIKDHKQKLFIKFLWMSGIRVTEAINIRKKDIDLNNYLLKVRWLKNRKWNDRILPLHPQLKNILEFYLAPYGENDLIFPFTRQRAWKIVKNNMDGHPHQLRHSFAVHWLRSGADIVMLQKVLGHSKIQTTMEYLRIVPIDQGEELIKIQF